MIAETLDRMDAHRRGPWLMTAIIVAILGTVLLTCGHSPEPHFAFAADASTGVYRTPGAGHMKITAGVGDTRSPQDTGKRYLQTTNASASIATQAEMSLTLVTASRSVLTITPDGRFILGPGATQDDAARAIVKLAQEMFHADSLWCRK